MRFRTTFMISAAILVGLGLLSYGLFVGAPKLLCGDQNERSAAAAAKNEARFNATLLDGHPATHIVSSKVTCNEGGVHGASTFATYEVAYDNATVANRAVIKAFGGQVGTIGVDGTPPGSWEPFGNGDDYKKYIYGLSDKEYLEQGSRLYDQEEQSGRVSVSYIQQSQQDYEAFYAFSKPFFVPFDTYFEDNLTGVPAGDAYGALHLKNISDIMKQYSYLSRPIKGVTIVLNRSE